MNAFCVYMDLTDGLVLVARVCDLFETDFILAFYKDEDEAWEALDLYASPPMRSACVN